MIIYSTINLYVEIGVGNLPTSKDEHRAQPITKHTANLERAPANGNVHVCLNVYTNEVLLTCIICP